MLQLPPQTNLNHTPLPSWATGHAKSYTDAGAQLCTKDGTKTGNAILLEMSDSDATGSVAFKVVTDAGNSMHLTETEIKELFQEPRFTMDPNTHTGVALWKARTEQEMSNEHLASLAKQIVAHATQSNVGTTAVVAVTVQCVVNLAFDRGEQVSPDALRVALAQNFLRNATDQGNHLVIDGIKLLDLLHE